jgi:predicted nucleic acid-binding Zn finger protein
MPKSNMPKSIDVRQDMSKLGKRTCKQASQVLGRSRTMQSKYMEQMKVRMQSFTSDKTYIVTVKSCTCPDYKFRRRARGESCKHMRALCKVVLLAK